MFVHPATVKVPTLSLYRHWRKLNKLRKYNSEGKHKENSFIVNSFAIMLMSPDSSSADPDPIPSSCLSPPSMIQVPECTQSHGGGLSGPAAVIKPHQIQIVDYKKIEPALGDYLSPPPKVHQSIFHQKPAMVPKSEEDLNLGKAFSEEPSNQLRFALKHLI